MVVQAELLSQFLYEVLIPDIMIKRAIFEEVLSLRADLADVDTIIQILRVDLSCGL